MKSEDIVAVVGLGYVGMPLAVEFGKKRKTIGFDLSQSKIDSYKKYVDPTGELTTEQLKSAEQLTVSTDAATLADAKYIVVAVPTPVDEAHNPDFTPLAGASKTVGLHMKKGRHRHFRVDRVSGCDRRSLHSHSRKAFRSEVDGRFPRRLFA